MYEHLRPTLLGVDLTRTYIIGTDIYPHTPTYIVAAWRSGNGVGRINEVTLRRARLVLGWVTCPGSTPGGGTLFRYVTSQPGRLSLSSFRGR